MSDAMDFEDYESIFANCAAAATEGRVRLVVARKGNGRHDVLPVGELTPDEGLVGDRWTAVKDAARDSQITLMRAAVVEAINEGALVPTAGDNLLVDFDLSEDALSIGTRLRVGSAELEVTPEPHHGCKKFSARFGSRALQWVNGKPRQARRLRGVHCRVIVGGDVRAGDAIVRADEAHR